MAVLMPYQLSYTGKIIRKMVNTQIVRVLLFVSKAMIKRVIPKLNLYLSNQEVSVVFNLLSYKCN